MKRRISWVRPLSPLVSRGVRVWVERGSRAYSAVTQPWSRLWSQCGTLSSTVTLHKTRVAPISIRTEPSGYCT